MNILIQTGHYFPSAWLIGAVIVLVETDILPPGLRTLMISLKALNLLGARQKAPLEITQSMELSGKGIFSISALTKET